MITARLCACSMKKATPAVTNVGKYIAKKQEDVANRIERVLSEHGSKLAKEVARLYELRLLKVSSVDAIIQAILKEIELTGVSIAVVEEVTPELIAAFKAAGILGIAQVGIDGTPAMTGHLDEAASAYAEAHGADLVKGLTVTTTEALRVTLNDAVRGGWSTQELSKAIQESLAFGAARANTIARTELATAHVQGNVQGWRETGQVEGKEWILGDLHDIDDECDDNASEGVVALEDDFSSGIAFPPAHPNCVCLLPNAQVWGPEVKAATRTLFEGEVYVIDTARGNRITATADHPILTSGGFVCAKDLQEGNDVICCANADGFLLPNMNKDDPVSSIKNVVDAFFADGSVRVSRKIISADFYQDVGIRDEKIGAIISNAKLSSHLDSSQGHHIHEFSFMRKAMMSLRHKFFALTGIFTRPIIFHRFGLLLSRFYRVSAENLRCALIWAGLLPPSRGLLAFEQAKFGSVQNFDTPVRINNLKFSGEGPSAILRPSGLSNNLFNTLPTSIFTDKVISIRRSFFSGHVYNLQTVNGWYCADGIITHNCDVLPVLSEGGA